MPGGELRLVDAEGRTIEADETPGELAYRGPNVMMGYATGRANLGRGADIAELRTGDLAVRDRPGLYRIAGRVRRMSKIAGLRTRHAALETAPARNGIEMDVCVVRRHVHPVYS